MPHTFRAHILGFHGSWSSGLAALEVLSATGEVRLIYCENAPTVRALDAVSATSSGRITPWPFPLNFETASLF